MTLRNPIFTASLAPSWERELANVGRKVATFRVGPKKGTANFRRAVSFATTIVSPVSPQAQQLRLPSASKDNPSTHPSPL
jgi:hypothetical protein